MIEYNGYLDIGPIFAALADPTRRTIVQRLARTPLTVGEIAEPFDSTLQAISMHLKVLERAGLLIRNVKGRVHHCRLNPQPLSRASAWATQVAAEVTAASPAPFRAASDANSGVSDRSDIIKQGSLMIDGLLSEIKQFDSPIQHVWDLETED